MNKNNNYNSILFLTTLSVYLGLVLVSGSAPVLAQAAMTRDFDIKNEIVFEDDLDKKPDDDKELINYSAFYKELYKLALDFSEKNRDKLRNNIYEFNCSAIFRADTLQTTTCKDGSGLFWSGFLKQIENIGKNFSHTSNEEFEQTRINLILSDSEFFLKSSFTQDSDWQADQLSEFYNLSLSRIQIRQLNNSSITIYQNTRISFENNQVFIVTRLPRGSIDALLAEQKDAQ